MQFLQAFYQYIVIIYYNSIFKDNRKHSHAPSIPYTINQLLWRLLWEIYLLADATTTHAVTHAQILVEILGEEATTVAGGLLSFYSFAADAAATIPVVAAMVVAITTTTAAAQSSGF